MSSDYIMSIMIPCIYNVVGTSFERHVTKIAHGVPILERSPFNNVNCAILW